MKLLLIGHTERYPVEQLQMQLFASEPSEFVTAPFAKGENGAVSNLFTGNTYVTATAKITWNGKTGSAAKRLLREQADVRHTRRILQQSYYLAAMQVLDAVPPWGALSGVRPSKLSTKALLAGKTRRQAERELEREFFVTPERAKLCVDASEHTVEAIGLLAPRDLSVYIGIPFCPTRCAYCSFVSADVGRALKLVDPYVEALLRERMNTMTNPTLAPYAKEGECELRVTAKAPTMEQAQGAYTHEEKWVLVTVLTRGQAQKLRLFVHSLDEHAFITIVNSSEIVGKGFRSI